MDNMDNLNEQEPSVFNQNQTTLEKQSVGNVSSVNQRVSFQLIMGIAMIMVLVAGGAYYLGTKQNKPSAQPSITQQIPPAVQPSPTFIIVSVSQVPDSTPQGDSLYLGVYQGKDALFITDKEKQKYHDTGAVSITDPMVGELTMADGSRRIPFNFKELINPRKLLSDPIYSVESFSMDSSRSTGYISLLYLTNDKKDLLNKILQVKLSNLSVNELWSNTIGSDKYPKGKGYVLIDQVIGEKYLTLTIISCYACEGSPVGTIVLNINSKEEKYYEMVGDMQFNLQGNTLTYKKLSPFKEACEPSPGCGNNGERTVFKPAGDVLTDTLP